MKVSSSDELRAAIIGSLRKQGYEVRDAEIRMP
jgi:lambda repressor-like predicted transcriptional regulator